MLLKEVSARIIKDSRNQDTIEVNVNSCHASSPSGTSTGGFETPSYHKSLDWNVNFINNLDLSDIEINSFSDLSVLEKIIKKKAKLKNILDFGANALFALESACLKALACEKGLELWQLINKKARKIPVPVGNIIGGGLHSHSALHPTFQEFLIIPQLKSLKENFTLMHDMYLALGQQLRAEKKDQEGAWETNLDDISILQILSKYKDIKLGIDVAANSFFCDGLYRYNNKELDRKTQILYINDLTRQFNLFYLEDPLEEDDFQGFAKINAKRNPASVLVVGDDLTVTHLSRLKRAVKRKSVNAVIVKPNQNGSLLQVKEMIDFCKKNNVKTIISHRAGETLDSALADYAVGFGCDFIKCGIATQWREIKLQRLVEIEKQIRTLR